MTDQDCLALHRSISERLRILLDERGMVPRALAEMVDIDVTTARRMASSESLSPCSLYSVWKVADFLGVSLDWLCGISDEREP